MADDPVWGSQTELTALLDITVDDVLGRAVANTVEDATGTVGRWRLNALLAMCGVTPGGRPSFESGVPVSTTDQTAKSTLYYVPDEHDFVRLWDGTRPKLYQFTERSLSLTLTSGKNYDFFLHDASGTLTLSLSSAWTTDSARADALAWQAGVGWVLGSDHTKLHLGTLRASGTNTSESSWVTTDAPARSFLWSRYNQRVRWACVKDSNNSWNYTTATWRQKNGSPNNQVEFVCGDVALFSSRNHQMSVNTGGPSRTCGVGVDSTSTPSGAIGYTALANDIGTLVGEASGALAAGYHYLAALERSDASGTTTWYGDAGVPTYIFTALLAGIVY